MVLVKKWSILVQNGPHVGSSGSSWKQFRAAGGSHTARVPAVPTYPLGLLLTSSSTSSPCLVGTVSHHPANPVPATPGTCKGRVSSNSAVETGEAFRCRDLGFAYPWGKPRPALAFHPFSRLKDPEHSGPSKCGPHQLAVVHLGVLRFLHQHDQKTGGTRVVLVGGFTSVSSRCP